jgi:hypothetical protein
VVIKGWGDLFQSDLVDMQHYKKYNIGYKYILFVIDVFTKMAYTEALKDKTAKEVVASMSRILARAPKFRNLQTDEGKEYFNCDFRALMTSKNINLYTTYSSLKAQNCERLNRTIKTKLWKIFSLKGEYNWLKNLQAVVRECNETPHSKTKMSPIDVKKI